eukprot:scaffold79924_cov75-Cyclotella_meneghiniana.AAC.1
MFQLTAFLAVVLLRFDSWWLRRGTAILVIPIGLGGSGGFGSGRASLDPDPNLQASWPLTFF